MAKVTLYNGITGLSCIVDAGGQGLRGKSWLDELSGFAHEAAEPTSLAGIGLGRLANFSAIVDGAKMGTKPLGETYSTPAYTGVNLFDVIRNSAVLATGDTADVTFGADALTENDRTHADYYNTSTDPDDAVAPVGGSAPAFLQTIADGGGINLAAGSGAFILNVNGVAYTVTVGTGGAVTVEDLQEDVHNSGAPVSTAIEGDDTLRIFTLANGVSQNISVTTSTAAVIIFTGAAQSSQVTTVYSGDNGPLGNVSNGDAAVTGGVKLQRRILPGSVVVTATLAAGAVELTDDRAGVLSDLTGAHVGTIAYATGAITLTFAAAPTATPVNAVWKCLMPVDLSSEVRLPEGSIGPVDGAPTVEMALILRS